jgi:hypothetical protein
MYIKITGSIKITGVSGHSRSELEATRITLALSFVCFDRGKAISVEI